MQIIKNPTIIPLAAAGLALGATSANAALIVIAPGGVTASTELPVTNPAFPRFDDHIVDGSGLTGGAHKNGADNEAWLSQATSFGGLDTDPFVIFDLGAVYTINSFHVWNYNENATGVQVTRGVNSVSVEYGITSALGSTVAGITNFAIADGTTTYTGEDFSSFTPFDAQFIKFDINTNHGDGNNFYGLSEVQFDGVLAVVPEPTTGALAGLSLLALAFRRRH